MLQPKRRQESPRLQSAKENDLFPDETSTGVNLQLYTGGALGEMALHVAVLWDGLEAAMVLVKEPAPGEPSVGRTARHTAVVNQNVNSMGALLAPRASISTEATGTAFHHSPCNLIYVGEPPSSLAACEGSEEIVRLPMGHGARVWARTPREAPPCPSSSSSQTNLCLPDVHHTAVLRWARRPPAVPGPHACPVTRVSPPSSWLEWRAAL